MATTLPAPLLQSVRDRVAVALADRPAGAEIADRVARYLRSTAETTVTVEHLPAARLLPGLPGGRHPETGIATVPTTFVITGDIPAMWLRDSAAQLTPLMRILEAGIGTTSERAEIAALLAGLCRRQWRQIAHDPYANAFNRTDDGASWDEDDTDAPSPWVWERKFELDSLSYGPVLARRLRRATGEASFLDVAFVRAAGRILDVVETEQDHDARSPYRFRRTGCPPSDTLVRDGRGRETRPCGLVWSGFRPSDDACELGFNVPGNRFLAFALDALADLLPRVPESVEPDRRALAESARRAGRLAGTIRAALAEHETMTLPDGRVVRAYEVDGAGGAMFLDDANVPSLLSLPMLGCVAPDEELQASTRAAVLSTANPYYVEGSALSGVGSPHTPERHVWPIGLAVEGLTTADRDRRLDILETLIATDAGTGEMHEGVHADDPSTFTRAWFSWANAMFCELAMDTAGIRGA